MEEGPKALEVPHKAGEPGRKVPVEAAPTRGRESECYPAGEGLGQQSPRDLDYVCQACWDGGCIQLEGRESARPAVGAGTPEGLAQGSSHAGLAREPVPNPLWGPRFSQWTV